MAGNTKSAVSNSSGNFSFSEVEVGHTYTLQASSKFYTFDPVVINLTDATTIDIRASARR